MRRRRERTHNYLLREHAAKWDTARPLDPIEILNRAAEDVRLDAGYWVAMSAAAHVNGYNLNDGQPSTVATYFPGPWGLER